MVWFVIEMQGNGNTGAVVPFSYNDELQAEAKYHTLLAAAALSAVPVHTVMLVRADGFVVKSESYEHGN